MDYIKKEILVNLKWVSADTAKVVIDGISRGQYQTEALQEQVLQMLENEIAEAAEKQYIQWKREHPEIKGDNN